jgi:hypothetical protein
MKPPDGAEIINVWSFTSTTVHTMVQCLDPGKPFAFIFLIHSRLLSYYPIFQLPATVWLAGFFNPQSFLTAIKQSTARKNEWPLDKMCLHCEVSKKQKDEFM